MSVIAIENQSRPTLTAVLLIAALASGVAVVVAGAPVLILGLGLATTLFVVLVQRPAVGIKLALFLGGIPLEKLGQDKLNADQKPLLRGLGGTTVDGLCLIALTVVLLWLLLKSRSINIPRLFWPYALFIVVLTISVGYSTARLEGLRFLLKVSYPVLIFFAALRFLNTAQEARSALKYWIAGGIVASIIGLVLSISVGQAAFLRGGDFRYSSGIIHESPFSMYMFALLALCYGQWRSGAGKVYGFLALLFGAQALAPETRITWAAILIGLLVFEATVSKRLKGILHGAALVGLLGFAAIYMIWHSPGLQHRFFSTEFDARMTLLENVENLNLTGRAIVWAAVFEDYNSHNHWIGQGAGTSVTFLTDNIGDTTVPHNEYLRVLHDAGLVGASLLVAGLIGLFLFARSLVKKVATADLPFARISLVLILGLSVIAITDNPFDYYLVFSQYVFLALALAVAGGSADVRRVSFHSTDSVLPS